MHTRLILQSLAVLTFVVAISVGATGAFFSDAETSKGNTLTAGAIDLQIDNHSYYNGNYREDLSWLQKDLETGDLLFSFDDVKPGDWGEDTISLHVADNDWWMCADFMIASSSDNGASEPELNDEVPYTSEAGELDRELWFTFWADDGDNVLEHEEHPFYSGVMASTTSTSTLAVWADSTSNFWHNTNTPLIGGQVYHVGVGWCHGVLLWKPVAQDGVGDGSINNPTINPGFSCDGSGVNNVTQSDAITLDVVFRAEQARHNEKFVCSVQQEPFTMVVDFEDYDGFTIGGAPAQYWDVAPIGGVGFAPSHFAYGGSQAGSIFFGSFAKSAVADGPATMTISLPDLSKYSNVTLTVALAAPDGSMATNWEITHRDSLRITTDQGPVDSFLPISSVSPLRSTVYGTDLHYYFVDYAYVIPSTARSITFAFASTDYDEVVGIDTVHVAATN